MCKASVSLYPLKITPGSQITHSNNTDEKLRLKKIESLAQDHTTCRTKFPFYLSPLHTWAEETTYTGVRSSHLLS